MTSQSFADSYWPCSICIGRVASEVAELLCISLVCHSYDSDRFCHINTVLLIVDLLHGQTHGAPYSGHEYDPLRCGGTSL